MPYEVCDAFIDDAVRYSQMDKMHLKTLRSQVMAAKDLGKVRTSIPRTKNENFSHLISMGYQ